MTISDEGKGLAKVEKTFGGGGLGASVLIGDRRIRYFTSHTDDAGASAERIAGIINAAHDAHVREKVREVFGRAVKGIELRMAFEMDMRDKARKIGDKDICTAHIDRANALREALAEIRKLAEEA